MNGSNKSTLTEIRTGDELKSQMRVRKQVFASTSPCLENTRPQQSHQNISNTHLYWLTVGEKFGHSLNGIRQRLLGWSCTTR